jgi:hypothetical protein
VSRSIFCERQIGANRKRSRGSSCAGIAQAARNAYHTGSRKTGRSCAAGKGDRRGLRLVAFNAQWSEITHAAIDLARVRQAKVASSTALPLPNEVKFQIRAKANSLATANAAAALMARAASIA